MKKKKEKEEMSYADRYREIGYKIAYCRKHMNLTQEELAEKLGVCETALCAYRLAFIHPKTGKRMQFEIRPEGAAFRNLNMEMGK